MKSMFFSLCPEIVPWVSPQSVSSSKKFNVEMTVTQANAIIKILPLGYTLQIDRECKAKRQNNRKKNSAKKDTPNPDEAPP